MKKIKKILYKIIIIYIISYIILSSIISSYGRVYDEACGKYVAEYAKDFINKYCQGSNSVYDASVRKAFWSGGSFGNGVFHSCCSTGVHYMFEMALGVDNLTELGYDPYCPTAVDNMSNSENWISVDAEDLQAGDILITKAGGGHTEMYAGNGERVNFGNGSASGGNGVVYSATGLSGFDHAFRLKGVDVTPNGKVSGGGSRESNEEQSIYGSNGFIFQGVPESSGYKKSSTFGNFLVELLKEIADWLIGLLTYLLRIVIVGWTSIVENLISTTFNTVTGIKNIDETESEETQTNTEETSEDTQEDENVQEGIEGLATSQDPIIIEKSYRDAKATITVENMVYNKVPFLDINFFNYQEASGVEIEEGTIIYIIRENIAIWYYILRIVSLAVMLIILIYLGIRIALSGIAEQKAAYKRMIIDWILGFALLFLMHYIMFIVVQLNDNFVSMIAPSEEDVRQYGLYETVRSKAYEIKASTGWAGTIMYIVLVYYSIRFMFIYLKRLLHIIVLTVLSPIVAIGNAVEKINKKGKSKGDIYGNWLKDYIYTVAMQSIHAIIYTIFITTILEIMEQSLTGILISFVFLNFMLKADKIMRKIVMGGEPNDVGDMMKNILPNILTKGIMASAIGKGYKKYLGATLGKATKKIAGGVANLSLDTIDKNVFLNSEQYKNLTKGKTEKEKEKIYEKYKENRNETIVKAIGETKNAMTAVAGIVMSVPMMVVDPQMGIIGLGKSVSKMQKFNLNIREIKGFNRVSKSHKYTTNSKNLSRRVQLERHFKWNGIKYKIENKEMFILDINGKWRKVESYKKVNNFRDANIKRNEKIEFFDENGTIIEEVRNKVKNKIAIYENLNGFMIAEDLIDMAKILQGGVDGWKEKAEVLNKAVIVEDKMVNTYQEAIDNHFGTMNWKFGESTDSASANKEFQKVLKSKQINQFNETVKKLNNPIEFSNIKQAVENYKDSSEEVKTRLNKGIVENVDYMKIAKEINNILEAKGEDVRVVEDIFSENVELAVEAISSENVKLAVEATKDINKTKRKTSSSTKDPFTDENRNAPKPNEGKDEGKDEKNSNQTLAFGDNVDTISTDQLIDIIRKETINPEVKEVAGANENHFKVAQILNEMNEINKESQKVNKKKIWKMDTVLNKLKEYYLSEETETEPV